MIRDPFKILDIGKDATKREIINASTLAMRKRIYSAREVAEAQKALMNPVTKAAHIFLCFIDCKSLREGIAVTKPDRKTTHNLKLLDVFDEK